MPVFKIYLALKTLQKTFFLSLGFTLFLWIYEWSVLPFKPHEYLNPYTTLTNLLIIPLSFIVIWLFFWGSFNTNGSLRIFCLLLFILAIATEYGYCFAMGRFSIEQDYYIGFQNLDFNLLQSVALVFLGMGWQIIFPIIAFALLLILTRYFKTVGWVRFGLIILIIPVFYSILYPFDLGVFSTVSFSAGWRTLTYTGLSWMFTYHGPREVVNYKAPLTPPNNIVFVVDESVRCDHLSLNGYERNTTPFLDHIKSEGILYNWGIASSNATSSLNSNTLMLTGINTLPDVNQYSQKKPTIFQYARAMGYKTHYFDMQSDKSWLMASTDLIYVDQRITPKNISIPFAYDDDFEGARLIHKIISQSSGNFIWINKMGLHFPYLERFPENAALWKPIQPDFTLNPKFQAEVVNTYDDALAYNLDHFFNKLIGSADLKNTVIVYTSDHGQTLLENGATWPHSGPTYNEACVPLFIISNDRLKVDTGYKASQANIFATLLDFMKFPDSDRAFPYKISLLNATEKDSTHRYYLYGTLLGQFRSEVIDFDRTVP